MFLSHPSGSECQLSHQFRFTYWRSFVVLSDQCLTEHVYSSPNIDFTWFAITFSYWISFCGGQSLCINSSSLKKISLSLLICSIESKRFLALDRAAFISTSCCSITACRLPSALVDPCISSLDVSKPVQPAPLWRLVWLWHAAFTSLGSTMCDNLLSAFFPRLLL